MAAPSSTTITDRFANQGSASVLASSSDLYEFDAGSDTAYLPVVSKAFEVSADATLAIVTAGGQTITRSFKAGTIYPIRVTQLLSTGTVLGGASVLFYC
jgi:hypothetical protein